MSEEYHQSDEQRELRSDDGAVRTEIFCRYVRRNGKIIFPKNAKFFHFFILKKAKK